MEYLFQELLATKHILKVGVSSFEDGQKLVKDYGCRVNGTLDLRTLADSLDLPSRKSLAAMCEQYLNIEMDKLIEVRCGDWDASTLSDDQVAYAACDALASVIIYHKVRKFEMPLLYGYCNDCKLCFSYPNFVADNGKK
jgi:ribonuclease D